jgi:hypothetical protein
MEKVIMRISIFIVTYKNEPLLNTCLESIFNDPGTTPNDVMTVTILNNYGKLSLDEAYADRVTVIDNVGRPSFSTGHLSRSWNQCILHGIRDINNPACDALILSQNDVTFKPNFVDEIKKALQRFTYIAIGRGDEVQVMTPESIKRIGMYDERFCNIGYQEADYFLRAVVLNREKTSINDYFHLRFYNPINNTIIDDEVLTGFMRGDADHCLSKKHHQISKNMFVYKWMGLLPFTEDDTSAYPFEQWDDYIKSTPIGAKQYIMYPYFECELPDLDKKYYNYISLV